MKVFASLLVAFALSFSAAAWAEPTEAEMYPGTVKKVMAKKGKLALKHGELKAFNMPPMTMVFKVENAEILQGLEKGDPVHFSLDEKMVIQKIEKRSHTE